MKYIALVVIAVMFGNDSARAQGLTDLLGKEKDESSVPSYEVDTHFGRNRIDLHLGPNLAMPRYAEKRELGFSARADLRMICGMYDLKGTFKHLLGKEAREEFLDNLPDLLLQHVVGSGMDLLCQAEPTVCNLLQNYSISANLKVGYYNDLCQAVEQSLVNARRKNHASAVEACLREKQAQGTPLDEAIEACQKSNPRVAGFQGELLGEFDLGIALQDVLRDVGLSSGAEELVDNLSEGMRISGGQMIAKPNPGAIISLYEKVRKEARENLYNLISQAEKHEAIDQEELASVVPEGGPPITEDEIRSLALVPPNQREPVLAALSSSLALYELTRRIHEVERALEALRGGPTVDEGKREMLDERLARLRNERRRLGEIYQEEARLMRSLAAAKGVAGREAGVRIAQVRSRVNEAGRKRAFEDGVRPWGSLPRSGQDIRSASARSGSAHPSNCGGCGLEYSFGSMGN